MARLFSPGSVLPCSVQGLSQSPTLFSHNVAVMLELSGDEIPVPEESRGKGERLASFSFGAASGGNRLDPYNPLCATPYRGMLTLVDGMSRNSDWDGDIIRNLEILAPEAAPSVSAGGSQSGSTGTVRYVVRYRNGVNDKRSGESERSATITVTNQFVTVALAASPDPQVTEIEVYRSLDNAFDAYYLVGTTANVNGNFSDDLGNPTEFNLQRNLRSDLIPGNTYPVGPIYNVLKAVENSGFVWYFGVQRMPRLYGDSATGTVDTRGVTIGGNQKVRWSRIQQKLKITGDEEDYRIIDIDTAGGKVVVDPPLKTSPSAAKFYIEDNRDGRTAFISVAGRYASIPWVQTVTFGADLDDSLMNMFSIGQQTFIISNDNLYFLDGARDIEPWFQIIVKKTIPEGQVGPNAGMYIPDLGYVYVDKTLGVRVFDGSTPRSLSRGQGESELIREWLRFNSSRIWYTQVSYNQRKKYISIKFARDEEEAPGNELVFSLRDLQWTGPWTRRSFSNGRLLDVIGGEHEMIGTDMGSLYQDHVGVRDGVESGTLSGTITAVDGNRITDTGASFLTVPPALFSCSVEIFDPFGVSQTYYISDSGGNYFDVLGLLDPIPQPGWFYSICTIPWRIVTGYLDFNEPDRIKELDRVSIRFPSGKYGKIRGAFSIDGKPFYAAYSGERQVPGYVWGRFKLTRRGTTFQFDLAGSGESESVEITRAVAIFKAYRSLEQ